jgi:pyrimidine-nucleoside phosphorylase
VNFLSLIEAKREGQALDAAQIEEIVAAFTAGRIPDYQMAAFLMAVYFRGLQRAEVRALTLAMRDSGELLKFPSDPRPLVDKHSTGGIGDKVSLPLAPLLACLGFRVPMISGRGLGITGGTLDKLDSIPGFQTLLPTARIKEIVQSVGCVICGQTASMVPADKALYALRDVTGTVPSIPLIVGSILSKKLAESLDALVLDVKFGRAAFMPTLEKARELARALVTLSNECGVNTRALLTDMDTPLGRAAGNWLEVKESVAYLEGGQVGTRSTASHSGREVRDAVERVPTSLRGAKRERRWGRSLPECRSARTPRSRHAWRYFFTSSRGWMLASWSVTDKVPRTESGGLSPSAFSLASTLYFPTGSGRLNSWSCPARRTAPSSRSTRQC